MIRPAAATAETRAETVDARARDQAEARLRQDMAIFSEAAVAADFCVFRQLFADGPQQWSDQVWAIHGLPRRDEPPSFAELRGLIHPEDAAQWERDYLALRGDKTRVQGELGWRIIRPDGEVRHLSATLKYTRDAEGRTTALRGLLRDVTEQRMADAERAASEAWLLEAAESAEVGLFDRDLITGKAFWSPRNWDIFGVPPEPEAPSYDDILAIVHPDDRREWEKIFTISPEEVATGRVERNYRIIRRDGTVRHLVSRGVVLRDASGLPVRNRGIIVDVTERRLADEALHAEMERFRHAAEVAELGVFERDLISGVRTWSDRMWRIYGLQPRAQAPEEEEALSFIHADDRPIIEEIRGRLLADASLGREWAEYRIVRPDGSIRHIAGSAVVLRDGDGRPARLHGVERDITEERELRAQAMITANMVTLGQMATGIAHELGQPLQAVATAAGILEGWFESGCPVDGMEMVRRQVARIASQADRAGQTMRHLLHFGRGGRSTGTTTAAAVTAGALDLVGASIRSTGMAVVVSVPETLPAIRGAQLEIEKVLVNLLINARDATEGRARREVSIRARCEGDGLLMDVEDTGGGVPEGIMTRVFEPMFTTKPADKGTGLGLSICRTTMRACGGEISLANTDDGARFSLRFQLA